MRWAPSSASSSRGDSGFYFVLRLVQAAVVLVPIAGQLAQGWLLCNLAGIFLRGFELGFDRGGLRWSIGRADVVGVNFPERRMLFDLLVEQRLSDGRIVDFAVTVAAVADEVDDDIGAELIAVFDGHASDANHRVHIFAIDVEDGNRLASRDAGGEARGMLFGVAGGESEKIVDDDVNGAADGVAGKVGVVHGLGENALSGECSVAVNQQWQIFFASAFTAAVLFGASAADGDGIDGFEMAGIRNQMDVNFVAAPRGVFAGRAHVILNVAGAENAARVDVFESGKDFFGGRLATWAITLRRPRWLMPMTSSMAPSCEPVSRSSSTNGISAVTPSSEKRLLPR